MLLKYRQQPFRGQEDVRDGCAETAQLKNSAAICFDECLSIIYAKLPEDTSSQRDDVNQQILLSPLHGQGAQVKLCAEAQKGWKESMLRLG